MSHVTSPVELNEIIQYVPSPEILIPILLELFRSHADLKCSKTGSKLFNADCHKAAKLIIEDVRKGWVSDPPGVAMFNRVRIDKHGLWIWHSIRGTSGLEGGIHHTVRSKFGSLGASVELTVALLSDYCYRKNVELGSRHRDGVVYDGHYNPWIEDDIDIAYQSLPFDLPRQTRPGYINVSLFKPPHKTFIISELPQKVRDEFDIPPHDRPSPIDDKIPPMPLVNLSGARTDCYGYLASVQDTKFALVPMHTNEEYRLFNKKVREFMDTDGQPNFKVMAIWWSTQVNGKTIFFKIPEHLQAHFKTWTAIRSEITTLHATVEQRAKFMNIIRSDAHTSVVLDESYSPVVQARQATKLSAVVATQNRRAAISDVPPTATASSSSTPQPRQIAFINASASGSGTTSPSTNPGSASAQFLTSTSSASIPPAKKQPKKKECRVCQSVLKNGYNCPGRGKREKCPWFGTPGAIGLKRLFTA
ncbi:hypothetical protein B0H13DRAFT_2303452 [Mycena leptocephala]|nr:hypothetical protein B0H13DRAFT_2303452 [Mycena leptocephala]